VTLGPREALATTTVRASPLRCAQPLSSWPRRVFAQVRARHTAQPATWTVDGDTLTVRFEEPVHGVAPGQALVVYDDDVVLGGAVIDARDDGAIPRDTRRPSGPATSSSASSSSASSSSSSSSGSAG
jgi:tRNA U34 2-thiouridine synthase MnmA/TrmU